MQFLKKVFSTKIKEVEKFSVFKVQYDIYKERLTSRTKTANEMEALIFKIIIGSLKNVENKENSDYKLLYNNGTVPVLYDFKT